MQKFSARREERRFREIALAELLAKRIFSGSGAKFRETKLRKQNFGKMNCACAYCDGRETNQRESVFVREHFDKLASKN